MKPYKFVLPVLAVAALGLSFPALAGQATAYAQAKKSEVKVGPVSVMNMVQAPTPPANPASPLEPAHPSLPYISVAGIDHEDLQAVLNEALSFKGNDAEFAKKAAGWKEKYGIAVTRKGPGHIILTKGEGKSSTRVEIHRSSETLPNSIAPRARALDTTGETRIFAPDVRPLRSTDKVRTLAPSSGEIRVLAPNSRRLSNDAIKQIEAELRGLAELKSLSDKDRAEVEKALAEVRKSLKEVEGTWITMPDLAELSTARKMSDKEKAAMDKELAEVRKSLKDIEGVRIIMPDVAELSTSRKLSDKERAAMEKELAEVRKSIRIAPRGADEALAEIEVFGTTTPGFRIFRYDSDLKGLSAADQKKMHDEMAKVHADSQKKIEAIMKKYQDKAKKSAPAKK